MRTRIGIVGANGLRFTPQTEQTARRLIRELISVDDNYTSTLDEFSLITVISGECHLGGVDRFAKEEALAARYRYVGHRPHVLRWEGFRRRNLKIARESHLCVCITVAGTTTCRHCGTQHVQSGGCWTIKQAAAMGRDTRLYVITGDTWTLQTQNGPSSSPGSRSPSGRSSNASDS